jgi:signal transduction histidine kinase
MTAARPPHPAAPIVQADDARAIPRATLRRRAEAGLRRRQASRPTPGGGGRSAAETRRLLHELQVHQIELEMQNEELQIARNELEAGLAKYSELYDFAPVGYYTLNRAGVICECNLAGASLLGVARSALVKRRFAAFVLAEQRAAFGALLEQVFDHATMAEGDLKVRQAGNRVIDVRIRGNRSEGGDRCQMAVVDTTEHRLAEEAEVAKRRLEIVTASNRVLEQEIGRRRKVEHALKASELHARHLLGESQKMQVKIRDYARQILRVQEDQRKAISRDLHDKVGQLLAGIGIHLNAFANAAARDPRKIKAKIRPILRLVAKSAQDVHRFARELRPASLDDLGLIPTLAAYFEELPKKRNFQIQFAAFEGVEALDSDKRMVLYRVTQEALTNVAKHAKATRVNVSIFKAPGGVCLEITDNGRAFNVESLTAGASSKRLGMIGMRERVDMVGGRFRVTSKAGVGTTVQAEVPFDGLIGHD